MAEGAWKKGLKTELVCRVCAPVFSPLLLPFSGLLSGRFIRTCGRVIVVGNEVPGGGRVKHGIGMRTGVLGTN